MSELLIKKENTNFNIEVYTQWLTDIKSRYKSQQIKAAIKVNRAMLEFYWELGKDIAERQFENSYGSNFFKKLSADLKQELPDAKGFSPNNLRYMYSFFMLYNQEFQIFQQVVGESDKLIEANRQQAVDDFTLDDLFSIPWGHHIQIINKCSKNPSKAKFYVQLGVSEYELSKLYPTDLKSTLPSIEDIERELKREYSE